MVCSVGSISVNAGPGNQIEKTMEQTEQVKVAIEVVSELAMVIRDAKRIPSGHLYAHLMGVLSLDKYEMIIGLVKKTGLVIQDGDELVWVGD